MYTRIALSLKVSYSDVGEGGVAVHCEKTTIFLNARYISVNSEDEPIRQVIWDKLYIFSCAIVVQSKI